jgi:VWFA-related protein
MAQLSRRLIFVTSLAVITASGVAPAADQQPTFRSRVDLVTVDVTVLGPEGHPIEGLGPEDFTLSIDGATRPVLWAHYIRYRPAVAPPADAAALFSSNEHVDAGRVILVAVDRANIRRLEGRATLRAAGRFIDALDRADRLAAASVDHMGPIEFSTDHQAVKRQIERLAGEAMPVNVQFNIGLVEALAISDGNRTRLDMAVQRECGEPLRRIESQQRIAEANGMRDPCPIRVEQEARIISQHARTQANLTLNSMKRLLARLEDIDGPKTLVLLSEGLVAEPQLIDLTELSAAAQAARATIYVLQLETPLLDATEATVSPTHAGDIQVRADGLARLAGAAGGALFRVVGADPYPFLRVVRELSGYYLLAFEPAGTDRDGRTHRIEVNVRRAAPATVRARPAFRIPPPTAIPATPEDQIVQLLRTPRLATELPLRVVTLHYLSAERDRFKVVVGAETEAAGPEVTLGFVVIDENGRIVTSATHRTTSGRYSFPIVLPHGRFLLRAAGIDSGGRKGSVERAFEPRVRGSGAVRISDLMLAEPAQVADGLLHPSFERVTDDKLIAYLELYTRPDWSRTDGQVTLTIARAGTTTAVGSAPATLVSREPGVWIAQAELSVADLPSGRYVARATVRADGAPLEPVSRSFVIVRE